jgi:parvulin-like peptidyl-prolyl isomerase
MDEPMNTKRSAGLVRAAFCLVLAACLALAGGCSRKDSATAATADKTPAVDDSQTKNAVILHVGESDYFTADFDAYIRRIMGASQDKLTPESLSRLFDRFVEDKLLLEAARRQGLVLTDEEKNRYRAKLEEEMPGERGKGLAPAEMDSLSEDLLIQKYTYTLVQSLVVTDQEIHSYYVAHKSDFLQPERVKVSQIQLKTEEKAIDVLARVKTLPEEGFRSVARQESIGPEADKSGEMGIFSPGQLPYEIEKVVFSLKEGEISQIVESSYGGYHIFRLDKHFDPEMVSEAQASSPIRTKLLDAKISRAVADHIQELRGTLSWSATPENLSFTYQRNPS